MNITEFLEARIAEDERRANYYGPLALGTARVLAECAAKRAIIKAAKRLEMKREDGDWQIIEHEDILEALAAVYSDNPDYQQEWAL